MREIEEQLAHLTRAVEDLSDMVAHQRGEIERLTRHVAMLMDREAQLEADSPGAVVIGDERPPHY